MLISQEYTFKKNCLSREIFSIDYSSITSQEFSCKTREFGTRLHVFTGSRREKPVFQRANIICTNELKKHKKTTRGML